MERYELRVLSEARLDEIAEQWSSYDDDAFEVELASHFAWCRSHLQHRDGDSHVRELRATTTGHAHALVELVNTKRGTLSKMLKLWVSPELWSVPASDETKRRAIEMHAAAFVSVIGDGVDNGFEEVKIYGRTQIMVDMLTSLRDVWNSERTSWTATMAGRWLAIRRVN